MSLLEPSYLSLFEILLLIDLTEAQFALLLVENRSLAVSRHLVGGFCFPLDVVPRLQKHKLITAITAVSTHSLLLIAMSCHTQFMWLQA